MLIFKFLNQLLSFHIHILSKHHCDSGAANSISSWFDEEWDGGGGGSTPAGASPVRSPCPLGGGCKRRSTPHLNFNTKFN